MPASKASQAATTCSRCCRSRISTSTRSSISTCSRARATSSVTTRANCSPICSDVRPFDMTSVPRIFDRVLAGVNGQAMKAGGMQAARAVGARGRSRVHARQRPLERGPTPWLRCNTRLPTVVLRKIRDRARPGSHEVFHQRKRPAAYRYGDDVPGDRHSDHAGLWPHRNVAGDVVSRLRRTTTARSAGRSTASTSRLRRTAKCSFAAATSCKATIATPRRPRPRFGRLAAHRRHRRDRRAGFLRITDRKNEIFKTDTGKWISPARDRGEHQAFDLRHAGDGRWQRPAASDRADLPELDAGASRAPAAACRSAGRGARATRRRAAFLTHEVRQQTPTWRATSRFAASSCCRASSASKAASSRRR